MTQIIGPVKNLSRGSGVSSQVYSSTAGTAQCFEQVFTQTPDPHPETEDWTNVVCEFHPSQWDEFSANVQLRTHYPRYYNNPLFRACAGRVDYYLSARFPVDGVSAQLDVYSKSVEGGTGELCSAKTSGWMPLSSIVGTGTYNDSLSACVAVSNAEFSGAPTYYNPSEAPQYYSSFSELRSSWANRERTALKGDDYLSGQFIFRTTGRTLVSGLVTDVSAFNVTASQVYSSTAGTACCYEQIFTQEPDPQPGTMDWTNSVCTFNPEDWDQFSASVYLSSEYPIDFGHWQGIFRAYYPPVGTGLSASLPVDGVTFDPIHTSVPTPEAPNAWKASAKTYGWFPISSIAGSATGPMVASVAIYNSYFNHSGMSGTSASAQAREEFSAGIRTALSGNDYLSGQFVFRKTGLSAIGG